ncbi:GTP 3',8-cyclase MoaA [Curvivirga sp.]|uniref:GTP 3',8-cyclase MoaA n=1 Tax=Curvivirga sp. TaxID=2856848 RepID=UPI003B59D131
MQVANDIKESQKLIDPFGRHVSYLRVSVTDRCDFRCVYCMSEDMTFLPKKDLLTLEELDRLCSAFVDQGVQKLRITGGEPLVRRDIMWLFNRLGRHLDSGKLEELTVTTNGSLLKKYAQELYNAGVRRINISLDTLDEEKFRTITRWGRLPQVLEGIEESLRVGLKVKLNAVALKGVNDDEVDHMIQWCGERNIDLTFIEVMPMGDLGNEDRLEQYWPLSDVKRQIEQSWTLNETGYQTGGPARYSVIQETGARLGFITPLTHNFCESCNRVRLTCTGTLYMCLGQEDAADLREPLRASKDDDLLHDRIRQAIKLKPKGHDFIIDRDSQISNPRHMSVTGG